MPQTDLTPPVSCTMQAKAILAGEHFVLHGVPSIAVPVPGFNLTLRMALRTGGELILPDPYNNLSLEVSAILDHRLDGFVRLFITSTIPQGAGLGSSAAFAVALGQALCEHAGFPTDESEVRALKIANLIEHQIHQRASGIDTAVVSRGTPIRFSLDERGNKRIETIEIAASTPFLLIDSGERRATHAQISKVRQTREQHNERFAQASTYAKEAVNTLLDGLSRGNPELVHKAIETSGHLLKSLGLEHESCAEIRQHAEALDVALKVTGAGGGGYMLAFASDASRLDTLKEALPGHLPCHRFHVGPVQPQIEVLGTPKGVRA